MKRPRRVGYQTLYLWTCPECGAVWQPRKRPREGKPLTCTPGPEQGAWTIALEAVGRPQRGCGTTFESTGDRRGLATT